MRVLMIASELAPFSKTGGLADVVSALSKALGRAGHNVTVVTPRYQGISAGQWHGDVDAAVAGRSLSAGLFAERLGPGAQALFVDCPSLYHRSGLYNAGQVDYPDNPLRFAFLVIAALEWAARQEIPVSVVHAHDWQAGLTPAYLRQHFSRHPVLASTPSVFTIHNLAYQGVADKSWMPRLGLGWDLFTVGGLEFWDRLSLLKAGVNFSDAVTTVSPTYAAEIQRPEYGFGFDGVMRARRAALTGILNGVDVDEWDPARDAHLPQPYSAKALAGKAAAKTALLEHFGLPGGDEGRARPLVGIVSRLADQKGFDLIAQAADSLADLGPAFVVLGSGDSRYEQMWRTMAARRPDRFGVHIGFDEALAHLIEGGADMFLMPSRYEPCGLNQMYSLRYGTVPIVRATGGLVDSVVPWNATTKKGTGFLFAEYSAEAMLAALREAVHVFGDRPQWTRLQQNGMKADFSWDRAAREYVTVYKRVIAAKRARRPKTASGPAGNRGR
ncbi:MAG: glycogen synthase GlgA [Acidobacteriota bacterium]